AKREPPHHLRTPPAGSFHAVQHTHTGPIEADARAPAEALQIGPPTGQRVHTVAAVKRAALAGPALQFIQDGVAVLAHGDAQGSRARSASHVSGATPASARAWFTAAK